MRKNGLLIKVSTMITTLFVLGTIFPSSLFAASETSNFTIAVLGTSDLHGQIMGYNYFTKSPSTGLTRIATLVEKERQKYPNNILVDAGDEIQGTPLVTDYNLVDKSWMTDSSKTYPMIAAFDYLNYDALVLGNHEFNFGLGVLGAVIDKADAAKIPYLSANTLDKNASTKDPVTGDQPVWNKVKPYVIKTFKDPDGKDFKVGILGLTTPAIPNWDAQEKWNGLQFADIVTEGTKWVNYLKETEKVNAIVAVIHSGLGTANPADESTPNENEVLAFANANPDVSMILSGHTHSMINEQEGTSKIWTVQPKNAAANLEEVVMKFAKDSNGHWVLDQDGTTAASVPATTDVVEDPALMAVAQPYHDAALAYLQTKIGTATAEFTADGQTVKDTALMDLVNKVQLYYGNADLSMAAPFSPTARIPKGDVTVGDVSSVYIYENYLYTIKVTGAQLKKYLELSVGRYYKQFKPGDKEIVKNVDPQSGNSIPDYNLDELQGASYAIDLTKSGLYDGAGKPIPNGEARITKLQYQGHDVKDSDVFKLAINDYRKTGGGGFMTAAGIVPQETDPNALNYITYDSRKTLGDDGQVRSLMIQYFRDVAAGKVPGVTNVTPTTDNNWTIVTTAASQTDQQKETETDKQKDTQPDQQKQTQTNNQNKTLNKTVTITAKIGLNVRNGASLSARKLGAIPWGWKAVVVGVQGQWYKIKYKGGYGYIYSAYTK